MKQLVLTLLVFSWAMTNVAKSEEFIFGRLVYEQGYDDGWARWRADWPEAEQHFNEGLGRLTLIDVAAEGVLLRMGDDSVFDYPWMYAVEVGALSLSQSESAQLREYLLRGGFLMVDDFHGDWEWQNFERVMQQVFPDKHIQDLDDFAPPFQVPYDLSSKQQIPGIRAWLNNRTWEKGGRFPHWRGILDEQGRVMVAINFNQDLGDAWEHADDARYPAPLTFQAYRMGVNYVMYAMTH